MAKQQPWNNRILGHGEEEPAQLLANPKNWRIHPKGQQDALTGALNDLGWLDEVKVNQRTGFVVDGHLRVALAISRGEPSVPVMYLDLSEAEEAEALAQAYPLAREGAQAAAERVIKILTLKRRYREDREAKAEEWRV